MAGQQNQQNFYISSGQAAKFLNVSPSTVVLWAKEGTLKYSLTPGGHRRFYLPEILELAQEIAPKTAPEIVFQKSDNGNANKGQSLVEFALVIGVLLLIAIGGLRIGLAITNAQAMNNVADAGVFRASLGEPIGDVQTYMQQELRKKAVDPATVSINITCQPASCEYGSLVTIGMTKTLSINALLWQANFPLTAQASAIVQKEESP